MSQSFQVAGYDKVTERLSVSHPLPEALAAVAREIAHVADEDDCEGIYPLEPSAAVALGVQMETKLNTSLYDWFLEPSNWTPGGPLTCNPRRRNSKGECRAMDSTQDFSITLPRDLADEIEAKVRSGAYASVSDVVRDGVRALIDREAGLERWLRDEVLPGHAEYLDDPGSAMPVEDVLARIKARRSAEKAG